MQTYQDLLQIPDSDAQRMDFVKTTIAQHKSSEIYRRARDAEIYYAGENPTISRYEKIIYDLQGRAHQDAYTANHKLASQFFPFAVDQESSYLLGNGILFQDERTADRLGETFEQDVLDAARYALIGGMAFGFWNLDHVQIFKITEFAPLWDEEDGALKAGVRWWQIDDSKPLRATLYELDGYTDYIETREKDEAVMRVLNPKRAYKQIVKASGVDAPEIYNFENYDGFPIVPLKNGDPPKSELCGKQNTIDALDLASSNMVNNVDEGNLIYWVLSNCDGMDELDDAKFIDRLRTLHVAHADSGGVAGASAEAHTIEAPYAGTEATIDMLQKKLYTDFQCFDASAVSAGNQTATAIKASYVPLDLKCDKFEAEVTRFILGILRLAGIDDTPTYTRSQIVNKSEETQTVLMGANYFDDEYITRKLLTILGDADQYEEMSKRMAQNELDRYEPEESDEDEPGENEQGNAEEDNDDDRDV